VEFGIVQKSHGVEWGDRGYAKFNMAIKRKNNIPLINGGFGLVWIVHPDKQDDKRANKGADKCADKYRKDNLIFKQLYDVKHTFSLRHIVNFVNGWFDVYRALRNIVNFVA
jgi:hypothetical protein